ncbi:DUF1345 domain-containing protein [Chitinophaga flava]|uniref:DUF1345 domain-containing protein n=1 Tax=Chitinophaga flava TaxID=2259036 RepID=A0A365Y690_9BACT|nr:DUF1345 domain-containing protein [Chitinophaga flava]RBL94029.1 DUF1345 domain-containing protein [Chitinophaga flava]
MKRRKLLKDVFNLHPLRRILISLSLTLVVAVILMLNHVQLSALVFYMLLWDVFAISYITTGWIVFFKRSVTDIRNWARIDDGSRIFVTIILLLASFASMVTIVLLMVSSQEKDGTYLPVAITGILSSWAMVHTTYSFHYANLYYDDDVTDKNRHAGGLDFPNEKHPDYLDFAYFSFVIGMTFQVSDVQIANRILRRSVLVHGLLSYILNTFVVALTINLIAGLKH